ncbi:MAG: cytochrome c family protein [Sphingomonadales bacterium]
MDAFEWNKIAAAGLIAMLVFAVVRIAPDFFFEEDHEIFQGPETAAIEPPPTTVVKGPSLGELITIAAQNPSSRAFRKCQACHDATSGGPNKIGPNLWNIVDATPGGKAGYSYSDAITSQGGTWDYNALDEFLTSPSSAVPGTKMTFAGIRTAEERAAIIAYLRASADNLVPLPEVPAEDASEEAGPASQ